MKDSKNIAGRWLIAVTIAYFLVNCMTISLLKKIYRQNRS
jgi:hypothetical protein